MSFLSCANIGLVIAEVFVITFIQYVLWNQITNQFVEIITKALVAGIIEEIFKYRMIIYIDKHYVQPKPHWHYGCIAMLGFTIFEDSPYIIASKDLYTTVILKLWVMPFHVATGILIIDSMRRKQSLSRILTYPIISHVIYDLCAIIHDVCNNMVIRWTSLGIMSIHCIILYENAVDIYQRPISQ